MARIPQNKIDEIRSAASIVHTISRFVSLKKAGRSFKGLCPFHQEKTPSFVVTPGKNIFHCFGCGKGGDVFKFLMEVDKISYPEAIRRVAEEVGIELPKYDSEFEKQQADVYDALYIANKKVKDFFKAQFFEAKHTAVRKYLRERKLKKETIQAFEIGYAPRGWDNLINAAEIKNTPLPLLAELGNIQKRENKPGYYDRFRNRLIFPFHNLSGRIVGFGGRRLDENDIPKYLNSPESKIYKKGELLYGLFQALPAIREKEFVILVEGYFDLLRLVDAGFKNVVASSGTAFTDQQAFLLKRYTRKVFIAYDSDEAGRKAALRNADILESNGLNCSIIRLPEPHDPDTFILENGAKAFNALISGGVSSIHARIDAFLAGQPNPTMEAKNQFIEEVIESAMSIKDDVKVGLFFHATSEKLEVPEQMIISKFNRLRRQRKFTRAGSVADSPSKTPAAPDQRRGIWRAEEGLIALLLENSAESRELIFNSVSSEDFLNDDYRQCFEKIVYLYEESGTIGYQELSDSFESDEIKQVLAKISQTIISNTEKFTADCIYQVRKFHVQNRFNEVKKHLKRESGSDDSTRHYMQELIQLKNKLSEIETERSKYIKINL